MAQGNPFSGFHKGSLCAGRGPEEPSEPPPAVSGSHVGPHRQSSVFFCPVPLMEATLSTEAWTSALRGVPGRLLPGLVTELGLPQWEGISRALGALRDPAVLWEGTSISPLEILLLSGPLMQ